MSRVAFDGRILVIGLGAVSRCTLPLLFEHVPAAPSQYTVIDFADVAENARWVQEQGAAFATERITEENYGEVLGRYVGDGDVIVDLAWNLGTADLLEWCRASGVRYVNASLEVWDPYAGMGTSHPTERTLYARHMELRDRIERWGDNDGPTAILDHGANPGLVSHFTKAALADIADAWLADHERRGARRRARRQRVEPDRAGPGREDDPHLGARHADLERAEARGRVRQHLVGRGLPRGRRRSGRARLGDAREELPRLAFTHDRGPRNQICLAHPGARTWVRRGCRAATSSGW